ncbi:SNF2-related protein [Streptomyces sp. NPDC049915]|uniref:DEAD/DEAH box helicase n=1 Tax=Streptomyces sp. NPDC049915 TaxID=3155510 RepID=UPI003436FFF7
MSRPRPGGSPPTCTLLPPDPAPTHRARSPLPGCGPVPCVLTGKVLAPCGRACGGFCAAPHAGVRPWPGWLVKATRRAAPCTPARSPCCWSRRTSGLAAGGLPRFSVTALLDFRWQLALDGADLTEEEMDALAEAARPLVRIRGQWVLADPVISRRARHRLLGQLPGTQALTAALTGTVTIAGDTVVCRPSGPLADVIDVLRRGEHHDQTVPAPAGLTASLRGYQERALTWLAHVTRLGFGAVLADDMGLGKALSTLAFTLHYQQHTPGPTLVVCPASLVTTWCREAARFTPHLPVVAYHGSDRTLEAVTDTTLVITTYGLLRRDAARLAEQQWTLVIADEAQHAKNPASSTARQLEAGRHRVMILSLKAAGTGLTLPRAAHVIHFDRSWNAAVEDQATDRTHRIGQHRTVSVHRLITEHTVEDRIDALLTRKRALASAVLTGGDQALTQLTDQELADLVALGERR